MPNNVSRYWAVLLSIKPVNGMAIRVWPFCSMPNVVAPQPVMPFDNTQLAGISVIQGLPVLGSMAPKYSIPVGALTILLSISN